MLLQSSCADLQVGLTGSKIVILIRKEMFVRILIATEYLVIMNLDTPSDHFSI